MNKREGAGLGFIGQVMGCLTSPRGSFRSILEKPSLSRAAALILVIAVIAAWASYNYTGKLPLTFIPDREGQFPGPGLFTFVNPEQLRQASMIVSVIMGFIGVFGSWLISSVLVHALSRAQGGRGVFRNMLILTGYASTPLLIQHLLRLIDSFMITKEEVLQLTRMIQVSTQPFLTTIANASINTFSIFMLWSIALFVIATHENYKISTTRSIVTVAVTYIIVMFLPL